MLRGRSPLLSSGIKYFVENIRTGLELLYFSLNLKTHSTKIKEFFQNKMKYLLFPFDLLKSELSWLCFERIRTVFNRHCSKSMDYSNSTRKKLVLKRVFLNKKSKTGQEPYPGRDSRGNNQVGDSQDKK